MRTLLVTVAALAVLTASTLVTAPPARADLYVGGGISLPVPTFRFYTPQSYYDTAPRYGYSTPTYYYATPRYSYAPRTYYYAPRTYGWWPRAGFRFHLGF